MDEKIGLVELLQRQDGDVIGEATKLLPAWFVPRMMTDNWSFGLLLVTGQMLHIEIIDKVRGTPGNVWIDVEMSANLPFETEGKNWHKHIFCSPTADRTKASINAAHVVLAVELAST